MNDNLNKVLAWNEQAKPLWHKSLDNLRTKVVLATDNYSAFLAAAHKQLIGASEIEAMLEKGINQTPLHHLENEHDRFYTEFLPTLEGSESGYDFSFANPDYACARFGLETGQLINVIYLGFLACRNAVFQKQYRLLERKAELFFQLLELYEQGDLGNDNWRKLFLESLLKDFEKTHILNTYLSSHPDFSYYNDVIQNADFSDLRYLYALGSYISDNDKELARFIAEYPEPELASLADYIVESFIVSFERNNKDYKIKNHAGIYFQLGLERMAGLINDKLKAYKLQGLIKRPISQGANRQYQYDSRFSNALYLDQKIAEMSYKATETTYSLMEQEMKGNAGVIYVESFGETPFEPKPKETALKLSDEQRNIQRGISARISQLRNEKFPRSEESFCIIAFPSPEIGANFKEIFKDTIEINRLDSTRYARIQQCIIDVLDKAEYVHVLGVPGNETDIRVAMHQIKDPAQETNFENCVADVNIPVGEVFTSPVLENTNGRLHVEDIYLNGLRFLNLKIDFKDGWVSGYSCSNFPDEEKSKLFIAENLLHPHQSLPIGEFAIGTNTLAYQVAKKHNIMHLLPILIIEKMGPHFAIGDTCYSHEEDLPHYNIESKKLIIAVENEKSITRKEDPVNAYTQKHTDITLPYEMLGEISAVTAKGERLPIIKDGKFVVPGTEELNNYL